MFVETLPIHRPGELLLRNEEEDWFIRTNFFGLLILISSMIKIGTGKKTLSVIGEFLPILKDQPTSLCTLTSYPLLSFC